MGEGYTKGSNAGHSADEDMERPPVQRTGAQRDGPSFASRKPDTPATSEREREQTAVFPNDTVDAARHHTVSRSKDISGPDCKRCMPGHETVIMRLCKRREKESLRAKGVELPSKSKRKPPTGGAET